MRSRFKFIALLAALLLVIAACGGDDDDTGADTTEAPATTEMADTTMADTTAAVAEGAVDLICEVTDVGGVDDRSFNASAWEGAQRAAEAFGGEAQVLESQAETDYEVNINTFIDQGCDIVVTVGFLLGDATSAAATANPDQPFAIVDFAYDPPIDNVKGLVFNTDEAAFLAGYLAAGMTQTGVIGTFGGLNIPTVTIFMEGYRNGAMYYNEVNGTDVQVLGWDGADGLFTENFESLDDGRAFAQSLVDEGADIVLPVAGPVGQGSAALALELGTDVLKIIGVDTDQYVTDENNSAAYLTSVVKRIDNAVFAAVESVATDSFSNELYVGTLENEGVGLAPFHDFEGEVPAELATAVQDLQAQIIAGEISVAGG